MDPKCLCTVCRPRCKGEMFSFNRLFLHTRYTQSANPDTSGEPIEILHRFYMGNIRGGSTFTICALSKGGVSNPENLMAHPRTKIGEEPPPWGLAWRINLELIWIRSGSGLVLSAWQSGSVSFRKWPFWWNILILCWGDKSILRTWHVCEHSLTINNTLK